MTILTTHVELTRLERWHRGNAQLFTRGDYQALEAQGLIALGELGAYSLTEAGAELLRRHGLLRTVLTGGRF